ncbi:hypothetical protein [Treponema sp.]|nr:hypothetical protein [Treponema sp.]
MKKIISIFKKMDFTTLCVYVCGIIGLATYIFCQIHYAPVVA